MNYKTLVFIAVLLISPALALVVWLFKPLAPYVAALFERWADDLMEHCAVMAVVATKSTMITNMDASPVVEHPAYQHHGRMREMVESFAVTNADDIASIYRVLRVWSGWRVSELLIDTPDIGATTIADVGLYKTAADGGAVVDVDFFASALSLKDGALAKVDITRENAVITPTNMDTRIWEQLGLTEDPKIWYDIALTLTAAADATAVGALRLRYTDGT